MRRFGRSPGFFFEVEVENVSVLSIWFRMVVHGEVFEFEEVEHAGVLAGGLEAFFWRDRPVRHWGPFFDVADESLSVLTRLRDHIDVTANPDYGGARQSAANAALRAYSFDSVAGYSTGGLGAGSLLAICDGSEETFMWTRDWSEAFTATVKTQAVDSAVEQYLDWWKTSVTP